MIKIKRHDHDCLPIFLLTNIALLAASLNCHILMKEFVSLTRYRRRWVF